MKACQAMGKEGLSCGCSGWPVRILSNDLFHTLQWLPGWWFQPFWNILASPNVWKIKNVPNHQSVAIGDGFKSQLWMVYPTQHSKTPYYCTWHHLTSTCEPNNQGLKNDVFVDHSHFRIPVKFRGGMGGKSLNLGHVVEKKGGQSQGAACDILGRHTGVWTTRCDWASANIRNMNWFQGDFTIQ